MSLSINLATRGRSEIVLHTLEATLPNISRRDTVLLVSVDADDAKTVERVSCFALDHPQMLVSARPREDSVGEKYNRVLKLAPADVYLMMVDYAPHMTHGFDQRILDAAALFPDNIGVVYNYMANASFPGINAVTAGLAAKMGGIYPTHFPYWFVDHWLDDIARLINRIAFADVVIDTSLKQRTRNSASRSSGRHSSISATLSVAASRTISSDRRNSRSRPGARRSTSPTTHSSNTARNGSTPPSSRIRGTSSRRPPTSAMIA